MNTDYIIAKEYLNRLPDNEKEKLCKRTLEGVAEKKKSKKDLRKFYSDYLDTQFAKGKI
ncbi:hypothetical protein ACR1PO_15505 [Chryseobacterium sp. RRHN12]|uniref:hypothetical protein n=1 Tax=Chryseobacterium sp. RRHN12 TaxID=3437884 RepID=UPI003D9B930A